jgi:flagellar biogenesis protein FliO
MRNRRGISSWAVRQMLCAALAASVGTMAACAPAAAEVTQHISGLQAHPDLPMPSATRVVAAVIVTLALAAGTLVLVKRFLPKYAGRLDYAGNAIKVLARSSISRSLRVHLIEVDTSRVLIVEGRAGIELAVLPQPAHPQSGLAQPGLPQPVAGDPQART